MIPASLVTQIHDTFGLPRTALNTVLQTDPEAEYSDWMQLSALVTMISDNIDARVVGVSGSQGSGKTTFANILCQRMAQQQSVAAVSLDDFYLTKQERERLSESVHPLLRTRGVPGTHDTHWLETVLAKVTQGGGDVSLPVFDKALDDRSGQNKQNVERLVIEGWCLGVEPEPELRLRDPLNALESHDDADGSWRRWVNQQIQSHYVQLWPSIDFWISIRPPGFAQVIRWRGQAEQAHPAEQRMTDEQLGRFVSHYERLTRWQWECTPRRPGISILLDEFHQVTQAQLWM